MFIEIGDEEDEHSYELGIKYNLENQTTEEQQLFSTKESMFNN